MHTLSTHGERLLSSYERACLHFEFRSTTEGMHRSLNALDIIQYHWIMFPSDLVIALIGSQPYTPLIDGRERLQRCSPDATINTYRCKTTLNSKHPSGPIVFFVLSRFLRALLKWKCITLLLYRRILPVGTPSIQTPALFSRITPPHQDGGTVSKASVCYI
jgi:hypothetical protein